MKIIAFSGRKQSGKSTSGDYLLSLSKNKNIKIYAFADRLKKDICINILGLTEEQCYGSDESKNTLTNISWKGKKLSAREVMEIVGTDLFRELRRDVWTSSTLNLINKEKPDIACIVDTRFPDEVDAIHSIGGIVVRLTMNPFNSQNIIECALDQNNYNWNNFDYIINNSNLSLEQKNNILEHLFSSFF